MTIYFSSMSIGPAIVPFEARQRTLERLLTTPVTIWAMLLVSIISGFAMRMTWALLPIYAKNVNLLTEFQYGLLQSIAMGISIPLYIVSGLIADRFGRVPCILLARGLGPFDSISLLLFKDFKQLIATYGVIGIAGGLGGGRLRGGGYMGGPAWQALIADIVPPRDRGKVMGFMGTVTGLIGLPGSYIGGYLYDFNPNLLLVLGLTSIVSPIPVGADAAIPGFFMWITGVFAIAFCLHRKTLVRWEGAVLLASYIAFIGWSVL